MTRLRDPGAALFVDFDGTIVNTDTAQIALDRFGDPDWMRIDQALERGEVSFEESLRLEFATLAAHFRDNRFRWSRERSKFQSQ